MTTLPFGMRYRPFRSSPDCASYYPATGHEQVLARLYEAVVGEDGLMLVAGEPGTGKTLLAHRLLGRLGGSYVSLLLCNTHINTRLELYQALLFDLGLPYQGQSEQELRLRFTEAVLESFGRGKPTLIIVDEAHHLSPDLLEELRLLGNLEAASGKAVQVLLLAQPSILGTLQDSRLAALRQRLVVRLWLEPLDLEESCDYVLAQLRMAGAKAEQRITTEALELIGRTAHGVPRVINQIAAASLHLAASADVPKVDAEVVLEALASLGLEPVTTTDAALGSPNEPTETAGPFLLQQPGSRPRMVYSSATA